MALRERLIITAFGAHARALRMGGRETSVRPTWREASWQVRPLATACWRCALVAAKVCVGPSGRRSRLLALRVGTGKKLVLRVGSRETSDAPRFSAAQRLMPKPPRL